MSYIGPKDHFWTYQPYLDGYGSYCDRCRKVRWEEDGKIIPHKTAVERIWNLGDYHDVLIEYLICNTSGEYLLAASGNTKKKNS